MSKHEDGSPHGLSVSPARANLHPVTQSVTVQLEVPDDLQRFELPRAVHRRLHELLDKQDTGTVLTDDERQEAEGLVDLAELLTLLRLRAERAAGNG